jgi:hypothetical protein
VPPASNLYVFTATDPVAQEHLDESIRNPIATNLIIPHLNAEERTRALDARKAVGAFYAWGAVPGPRNIPNWRSMAIGDHVLTVYDGTYHYCATVKWKVHSRAAALAIWGESDAGEAYEYMYFLSRPRAIEARLGDVADYLNALYFGFTRIGHARIRKILRDFGSVESFVKQRFGVSVA